MVLPEAITAGVTTGHNAHHIELHEYWNGLGNVFNVTHSDYGAVPGGSAATNAAAINDAVVDAAASVAGTDNIANVVLPVGHDFPVTPGVVNLATGVQICGGGTVSTTQTTAGAFFTIPAGTENCGVDSIVPKSPNDAVVLVQIVSAASAMSRDIDITNNRCIEARLVQTNDLTITYAGHSTHATTGTVTRDVRITGNRGTRSGANVTNLAFCLLWYTVGAEVIGNRINGYGYGIQWWGGDANPITGNGDLANERKCGEFTITSNRVSNIEDVLGGGAGIWGSMGYDITVGGGNIVKNCADVGIDFEGCDTWACSGNVVTNCVNGCLTSFFFNRDGEFGPNTCRQDDASTHGIIARVQNEFGTTDNEGVTFTGGSYTCRSGVAKMVLETADRTVVNGARMTNVLIFSEVNNQRHTEMTDCKMVFTTALPMGLDHTSTLVQMSAIFAGMNNLGGRLVIQGNKIESLVAQPAAARAIRTYQFDPTRDVLEFIDDNICLGWTTPIETIWDGANEIATARTFIRRNTIDVGATIVNTRGPDSLATGVAATIVREGNRYADGTAAP